jgi:glycosyltransferase involved in cell wall biosynthesis
LQGKFNRLYRQLMNLIYTITSYSPAVGGAQIYVRQLVRKLKKKHTVEIACHWSQNRTDWLLGTTLKQPASRQYVIDDIPVNQLGLSRKQKLSLLPWIALYYPLMDLALPPIASNIVDLLEPSAMQADLIHNVRVGREGLSWASFNLARQKGIPFVFTPLHHPRWTGWRYRKYIQLYQQADALIALTKAEKQILVELGVHPDNIHVTGMGPMLSPEAAPESFRAIHKITRPMVLFLGQHYDYKGYRHLLEATTLVWARHPDTHFVFIGPAVKKSEKAFVEYADPRIHRLGAVSLQEKTNALAACTLLCVPSMQESFGGVYTEAWYFGKPVIGGNIPAIADVIQEGINGYLVEQQPSVIADRIIDLLDHPTRSLAMGEAGREKTEKYYSWSRLATATEQVYQSLT